MSNDPLHNVVVGYGDNRLCNRKLEELMDHVGIPSEEIPENKFGKYIFDEVKLFRRHCLENKLVKLTDNLPDAKIFGVRVKIELEWEDPNL